MKKIALRITLLITILLLSLSACAQKPAESKAETRPETSHSATISAKLNTSLPWLQVKIWEYQSQSVSNPPRSVIKSEYEGKTVYYIPPVCCDIPSELYAEDGKLICYPGGGFSGRGDGKCSGFVMNGKPRTVVWQDERKANTAARIFPVLE